MKADTFAKLSDAAVAVAGHRFAVAAAITLIVGWTGIGIILSFPGQWYLVTDMLGTLTTVIVLLVIQHSQNRDMHALQVKVDELNRSSDAGNHVWSDSRSRNSNR
jgi:low affinity Fe/Cu permease